MTSIRSEDIIQTLQSLNLIRYLYLLHLQTSYLTQHLPSIPSLAILKNLYRILSCRFLSVVCVTFWNCCLTLLQTYVSDQRFPQFFLGNTLCRGTCLFCFPSDAIENFLFWMLFWSLSFFLLNQILERSAHYICVKQNHWRAPQGIATSTYWFIVWLCFPALLPLFTLTCNFVIKALWKSSSCSSNIVTVRKTVELP